MLFYLLLLIPYAISQSATVSRRLVENCLDFDIDELEDFLSALNLTAVPSVEVMTAGFQCPITALPFGALKSDWARLLLLYEAQADGSTLRQKLRRLFRVLVVAFYQMDERFELVKENRDFVSSTPSFREDSIVDYAISHPSGSTESLRSFVQENPAVGALSSSFSEKRTTMSTGISYDLTTLSVLSSDQDREIETINTTEIFTSTAINLSDDEMSSPMLKYNSGAAGHDYKNIAGLAESNIPITTEDYIASSGNQSHSIPQRKIERGDGAIYYLNYGEVDDESQTVSEELTTLKGINISTIPVDDSIKTTNDDLAVNFEATNKDDFSSSVNSEDLIEPMTYKMSSKSSSPTSSTISSEISLSTTTESFEGNSSDSTENVATILPNNFAQTSERSTDEGDLVKINDVNGRFNDHQYTTSSLRYSVLNYPDPSLNSVYKIHLHEPASLQPALLSTQENGSYQTVEHKIKKPQIVKEPPSENLLVKYPLLSRNVIRQAMSTESSVFRRGSSTVEPEDRYTVNLLRSKKRENLNTDTENQYRWFFKLAEQPASGDKKSADAGIVHCRSEE